MIRASWKALKAFCGSGFAAAQEAFKVARLERQNRNWRPEIVSGDTALGQNRDLVLARERDLFQNAPSGTRIATMTADIMVGSGILSYADPYNVGLPIDVDEQQFLRWLEYADMSDEHFDRWAESASATTNQSYYELERLCGFELCNVGDAMLLECWDASKEVPVCYQVLEKDMLDCTKDREGSPGQNAIENGIEYDFRTRRPVAYHFYHDHPGSEYATDFESSGIPADRIIHAYIPFRPSAHSGISWYVAATQPTKDIDWYLTNELTSSALAATMSIVHKSPHHRGQSGFSDGMANQDRYGNERFKLAAGAIYRGGKEDSIEVVEGKRPSRDASPFLREIRTEQSMASNISLLRLTGDYKGSSYTAARGSHIDDYSHFRPLQNFFAQQISMRVRKRVNAVMASLGQFGAVLTPQQFAADQLRYQRFGAIGPGREQLDPERETEAASGRMRNLTSNLQIECGLRGLHWLRVMKQRRVEQIAQRLLGVEADFSKGGGEPSTASDRGDGREAQEQQETAANE